MIQSMKQMYPIITFGDYSYATPPPSPDKMLTIKYILQKEIDISTNLLKDLESKVGAVSEVSELVVLLKVIKDSHAMIKN